MLIETLLGLFLGIMLIVIAGGLFDALASDTEERLADATRSPDDHFPGPATDSPEYENRLRRLGGYR